MSGSAPRYSSRSSSSTASGAGMSADRPSKPRSRRKAMPIIGLNSPRTPLRWRLVRRARPQHRHSRCMHCWRKVSTHAPPLARSAHSARPSQSGRPARARRRCHGHRRLADGLRADGAAARCGVDHRGARGRPHRPINRKCRARRRSAARSGSAADPAWSRASSGGVAAGSPGSLPGPPPGASPKPASAASIAVASVGASSCTGSPACQPGGISASRRRIERELGDQSA